MKSYDVIVIGGGGGSKITTPAAALGKKVAVIEKDRLGGTCLNRGCIPSKMLIHPADVALEVREAHRFDLINDPSVQVDFEKLVTTINTTVKGDSDGIVKSYGKNPNIDFYHGEAHFLEDKVIEVNGETLTAPQIVIAVGSRPSIPDFKGLEGTPYWTSTEALTNTKLPKKLIVIGGGYIGTELGHAYGALGSEVNFLVRSKLIKEIDSEVQEEFSRSFKERYNIHTGVVPKSIEYIENQFHVVVENSSTKETLTLEADALLIATGVTPNNDTLHLEKTSIKINEKGYVKVDDHLMTSANGVYAIGDCIGRFLFRHSVNFEGEYLFNRFFKKSINRPIKYPPMPWAVFTNPQVAGVGYTEEELIKSEIPYVKGVNPYKSSAMGMALRSEHGLCKILIHKETHRILGAHIVGVESSNMIHMLIAFISLEATLENLLDMIYIHPALPEIVRNAARKAKAQL